LKQVVATKRREKKDRKKKAAPANPVTGNMMNGDMAKTEEKEKSI
jgi:hypothetical protein